ncbi:hypothetical protein ACVGVM_22785 [Pseudonocardia bannensis]|uniref:Uncharacterized protein n=1 Tax=Pseudonocardia bannensis TaxID=630973 RepID=A0A848DQ88_9PSEU|nr:hypothetical protein [Pseudonocardia bannensis]NMH94606.1 hypothetical protein [Pseudonocardia bannensis]
MSITSDAAPAADLADRGHRLLRGPSSQSARAAATAARPPPTGGAPAGGIDVRGADGLRRS